jgi:ABC-type nitrate/sulfonate/bicarbonate transport system substrate-binding protein
MKRNSPRGRLATAFATAFGVLLGAHAASALTILTVGKAAPDADTIIPVNIGDELGIFKKHGLELKIVNFNGGSKMATAMAAGSLDIGVSAGAEMALVAKGVPMTAVCDDADPLPFVGIGVPYDSPVHSIAQLKGRKIGFSSAGSLTDWLVKELVRKEGWAPGAVTGVAIGNSTGNIVSAFRAHLVDADVGDTSRFLDMELNKTGRLLIPVSKYEGNLAAGAFYASDHLIKTDPAAVRAFIAGWLDTIHFMRSHKAETVKLESAITGYPQSVMAKEYDLTIGMFTSDCKFSAQALKTLKRSFVELKLLRKAPDMSKLYTERFLPKSSPKLSPKSLPK